MAMSSSLRTAVFLAVAAMADGCYDTPVVNPHADNWLIDDFEGNVVGYPRAHIFEPWECRPDDAAHPIEACEVVQDPDGGENKVLHLRASLYHQEGNDDTFTRAEVATFAERSLDLGSYASLELHAKLDWQGSVTPKLKAVFSCADARLPDGGMSPNPCVLVSPTELVTNPGAGPYTLVLDSAQPPAKEKDQGLGVSKEECLGRVSGIKITVDSEHSVPAGQTQTFDLYVDNVVLVPKR
jgi:hypothetical protein